MVPFLKKTAQYIIENYENQTIGLKVILPNKRASLYLKKHLAAISDKPIFCPEILSIEDFIVGITDIEIAETVFLQFEFYKAYCEAEGTKAKPFQEVFKWSAQVLNDFNEIDLYLIKTDDIFKAVDEASIIKTWNLGAPLTAFQQKYLAFYRSLGTYYNIFTNNLINKGLGYQGLVYRNAANRISKVIEEDKHLFLFAGLNALTASEEKIIFELYDSGKAQILWDSDEYYVKNTMQEAGYYMRRYFKKIKDKEILWLNDNISTEKKKIIITGVQGKVLQAKHAGSLIDEYIKENSKDENIALVLADEKLLFPVLNSIPEKAERFNITMGMPLSQLPVSGIYQSIFKLHLSSENSNNSHKIYTEYLLKAIEHPYVYKLLGDKGFEILNALRTQSGYVSSDKIIQLIWKYNEAPPEIISLILKPWKEDTLTALNILIEITTALKDFRKGGGELENVNTSVYYEYRYLCFYEKNIIKFRDLLTGSGIIIGLKSFYSLFKHSLNTLRLPFYGEPLQGLQIMGLLETRSLDFEKIILLSVNENVLPAGKPRPTFIPADIRKGFGLPMLRENDSLYAYHFYRMLQGAKEIHLIYNTQQDTFGAGEKSRFIMQLEHELPKVNPDIEIINNLLTGKNISLNTAAPVIVQKTDDITEKIKQKAKTGLAPSALNSFIACPLKFYFHEIARIPDPDDDPSVINHAKFGSAVHDILKELYKDTVNMYINQDIYNSMLNQISAIADKVFSESFQQIDITSGKNMLAFNAAKRMTENFIKSERRKSNKETGEYTVKLLEQRLTHNMNLTVNGEEIEIMIKGQADRVDVKGNTALILDYKTGKTTAKELQTEDATALLADSSLSKCFQLLVYTYLFAKQEESNYEYYEAGIITVNKPSDGILKAKFSDTEKFDSETLSQIEEVIVNLITNIFDREKPFIQTDKPANCKHCIYAAICSRD